MSALSTLGQVHTLISLVAVGAGIVSFASYRKINPGSRSGMLYIWTTVLTCLTGFGIFAHGGWGAPHTLGVITLVTLAAAYSAGNGEFFGRAAPYVEVVAYSATFLFHMIPAITETSTRLPVGAPWLANAEAPELKAATGVLFLLFLAGSALQVRSLRVRLDQLLSNPVVTKGTV